MDEDGLDEEDKLHELYRKALQATEQSEADRLFDELVDRTLPELEEGRPFAEFVIRSRTEDLVRHNLGYMAADQGSGARERIERLYNCEHPLFGKVAEMGFPTFEESVELGKRNFDRIRDSAPYFTLADLRREKQR